MERIFNRLVNDTISKRFRYSFGFIYNNKFSKIGTCFILLSIFSIYSFSVQGCLLFSERNPESPLTKQINRNPPTTANEFFSGLKNSLETKNPLLYMSFFSRNQNYRFYADTETAGRYSNVFENFDITKEERFIYSLLSRSQVPPDSAVVADFKIETERFIQNDLEVEVQYTIQIGFITPHSTTVNGRSVFLLIRDTDGGFVAKEWKDFRIGNFSTISEWKAIL